MDRDAARVRVIVLFKCLYFYDRYCTSTIGLARRVTGVEVRVGWLFYPTMRLSTSLSRMTISTVVLYYVLAWRHLPHLKHRKVSSDRTRKNLLLIRRLETYSTWT